MTFTTTAKVFDCLNRIFVRFGLPASIKSDNGPQFLSSEFREFCELNGIEHHRVTARWAQAIGEVERQNRSLPKQIPIAQAGGLDWKKDILTYFAAYRGMILPTTARSPFELLFSRKMRGKLPDILIDQPDPSDLDVRDRDSEMKTCEEREKI